MRQKAEYRIGVGASSILMILVTLALAALALLSLYAAKSNAALCKRNVEMTVQYYHAADDTQHILAAIDESQTPEAIAKREAIESFVCHWTGEVVPVSVQEGGTFAFSVGAGAGRTLATEGVIRADGSVSLTRHTLVSAPTPTETPLPVFQP